MARRKKTVTTSKKENLSLPEWTAEYFVIIEFLHATGTLKKIEQKLQLERKPGYAGIDLFLFTVAWFICPKKMGLQKFARKMKQIGYKLMVVANRELWPSPSSISRCFDAVIMGHAQKFLLWLLQEGIDLKELMALKEVMTQDVLGQYWHIFDYDPTVQALRQRALPEEEDLPEPKRRSRNLCAEGYSGRKRGEVLYSRTPFQHAGSSLWVWQTLSPGNGEHIKDIQSAVAALVNFCSCTNIRLEQTFMRFDGGNGGVQALLACRDQGVIPLTRIARYNLLKKEAIVEYMKTANWMPVEDSGSGPKREATELGNFTLVAKKDSKTSINIRVVVSRFISKNGKKKGSGIVIDGWQYEMFATDLPANHWPAAQTVTAYYGRCGQENRFNQEDNELKLNHTMSFTPAGQLLGTSIGLFIWNLRVVLGSQLVGLTEKEGLKENNTQQKTTEIDKTEQQRKEDIEVEIKNEKKTAEIGETEQQQRKENLKIEVKNDSFTNSEMISNWLSTLDWSELLQNRPGFSWDDQEKILKCPAGHPLLYHGSGDGSAKSVCFRLRARKSDCYLCNIRQGCTNSISPNFQKKLNFSVARDQYVSKEMQIFFESKPVLSTTKAPMIVPTPLWTAPSSQTIDSSDPIKWSMLLPAKLREHFMEACERVKAFVSVTHAQTTSSLPFYLTDNSATRQHRRRSWNFRNSYNALNKESVVRFQMEVPSQLQEILKKSTKKHLK